jgi:chlorophyllide a reductase subunit Z
MPSDLAEIRRLVEGIGAEVNMTFPLGSHLATSASWPMPTSTSACTASSAAAVRGAGSALPAGADRHAFDHQSSCARWARCSDLDPEPFIEREKHTTIKPLWDLWRSVTQDFFGTASFAVVAGETYERGMRNFLEDEMGLPCTFAVRAGPASRRTTRRPRKIHAKTAADHVRLLQRAHVSGRSRARAIYIPASFPGAIIRRHTGTPFMGYSGACYLIQEVCNALFDALFNILPLATDLDAGRLEATAGGLAAARAPRLRGTAALVTRRYFNV